MNIQKISKFMYFSGYTSLSENIVLFCRYLRHHGMRVSAAEQADALRAMRELGFDHAESLRLVLRAVLARSPQELQQFDELYEAFWRELERAQDAKIREHEQERPRRPDDPARKPPSLEVLKNWLHGNKSEEEKELAVCSSMEVLAKKDFSELHGEELQLVMQAIAVLARSLATRYSRRYRSVRRGGVLDMKKIMRSSMRRGGEVIDLAFRQHKIQRLRLVMLCDTSKSMDLYSRFLIQFMYSFHHADSRIETFVFSTRLHRITAQLQQGSFRSALQQLSDSVPDWSGGTRIGASLKTFAEQYGPRLLDARTLVLIMSDGWDTGETDELEQAMQYLHARAGRVIWLNPLAGSPAYSPEVRGMKAAMPYIDIFAPVHNLESLKALSRMVHGLAGDVWRKKRR